MDYKKTALKTKNTLKKKGTECYLLIKGAETYNPLTDEYESTTTKIKGYGILQNYDFTRVNNTLIENGDVNILCYFDYDIRTKDIIEIGNKEYQVINVNALKPDAKTVIYYDIQAR